MEGLPGRKFDGRIDYIYPYLDMKTRTAKVRLEFDNADGALLPQMFADVTLQNKRSEATVLVPAEAVVRSGTRKQVFVVRSPGKFEPHEVEVGVTSEGKTQILEGISAGDEVVTSAQFLIDSESSLREATAKMLSITSSTSSGAGPSTAAAGEKVTTGQGAKAGGEMKMDSAQGRAGVAGDTAAGKQVPPPEHNHD